MRGQIGELSYELTIKARLRNINLRVRSDGSVHVSAPRGVDRRRIDAFLLQKYDWILRAQARAGQRSAARRTLCGEEGETFPLLGAPVTLRFAAGRRTDAPPAGGVWTLHVRDPEDAACRRRALASHLTRFAQRVFARRLETVYASFAAYRIPYPTLVVRQMTARYGSCNAHKGVITLSRTLVHAPVSLIDFILAHECAHLVECNHAPAFYRVLASVMPDHAARRDALRALVLPVLETLPDA
nr:SprT family zinc-dependent metalloprotease [Maliibacterium massiliense]